ncbi:MAG: solute carrier 26 family protein [Clostridia bacterium]|nr:solute carrier 26 family protein [Clostridia bacterium]
MKGFFHILEWLPNYDRKDLAGDFSAGLVVAIMLIPQAIAYAMLAGLPPVMGLYASTIPLIAYALFGTSRQLGVGPIAVISLLVLTGVSSLAEPGTGKYISLVILLTFMVGIIQFIMGALRLGFIVNFVSQAVISGFISATAIVIGFSQLKHLLGISLQSDNVFLILWEIIMRITDINPITFAIGIGSILILVMLGKHWPKVPAPLVAVVLSSLLTYFLGLEQKGVNIVGDVPGGLPSITMPFTYIDGGAISVLLPTALAIAFIGFMEAIAIGKAIAMKEKYKVVPDQELIGLGVANLAGSLFSGYPVTGAFSRTAVNYQSGGRTQLASMITAVLIILTLLFFTGLFYYLPNAVLAAIIIVAVYKLIDLQEARYLLKVNINDGMTWIFTFLASLVAGIGPGILTGFVLSLIFFIWRSAHPYTAELGYLRKQDVFRDVDYHHDAEADPHILIFRVDAPLFFANMGFLEDQLYDRVTDKPDAKWIVLDFSGVNSIDAVAVHSLENIVEDYGERGIQFKFTRLKRQVKEIMSKAGSNEILGKHIHYFSIRQALDAIDKKELREA